MSGKKSEVKAIICDMGGVIHNIENTSPLLDIAIYYGQNPQTLKDDYSKYVAKIRLGGEAKPMFQFFSQKFNKAIPKDISSIMSKGIKTTQINQNLVNYLVKLKKQGIKLFVLSNTIADHSDWIRQNGWYDYFDNVFLSHEIKLTKPDPRSFEHVIEEEKLNTAEVIYIDDLAENIEVANSLGLITILAESENHVIRDLDKLKK